MPLSRSRDYLSIGEVLDNVREDFPDISISKIRFLESEGLIAPERTSSGYRKFYDHDVKRLRHILSLQKDHFLPLKVIRARLTNGDKSDEPTLNQNNSLTPVDGRSHGSESRSAAADNDPQPGPEVRFDRDELRKRAGLDEAELAGLEDFGVLARQEDDYGVFELAIATAAKGFFDHGVEARHLRMYRQAAEREAAVFEQIIAPVTRRKAGDAANHAAQLADRLSALSRVMRDATLRSHLQSLL
jgi:DNA-binding transcriptional MerR regulator